MTPKLYALLVGIDQYQASVPALHGCKNDIEAVRIFLTQRQAGTQKFDLFPRVLKDEQATYTAVVEGFREHLRNAGPEDVVLFYYSGHGSQEDAPEEFWTIEPDHQNETLVLYDSRTPGNYGLADKELAKLITEVADRGPHVLVVLDCCHSGSGTRGEFEDGVAVRRAPTDTRQRPMDSYLVSTTELNGFTTARGVNDSGWEGPQRSRHVLLAACLSSQTAKEVQQGGEVRGAFSVALLDALQTMGSGASYRDVLKQARANVLNRVTSQTPQFEASNTADLQQSFLGGVVPFSRPYFTLSWERQGNRWMIDAGAVQGLRPAQGSETTTLALFDFGSSEEDWYDLTRAVGTARVTNDVEPARSQVEVEPAAGKQLQQERTYRAVITGQPLPALGVFLEGDPVVLDTVRHALNTAGLEGTPSPFVREVRTLEEADYQVQVKEDRIQLSRARSTRLLVTAIPLSDPRKAERAVDTLEHMARFHVTETLQNRESPLAGAAVLEAFLVNQASPEGERGEIPTPLDELGKLRLEYQRDGNGWRAPSFKLRVRNTSEKDHLYCAALYLDESYGITLLLPGEWLDAGEEAWVQDAQPIKLKVPDDWYRAGITEVHDRIKLIVSDSEFDATSLEQPELNIEVNRERNAHEGLRSLPASTLDALLSRVQLRHLDLSTPAKRSDWATDDLMLKIVRPLESVAVQSAGGPFNLVPGVSVGSHPHLQADVRLTSVPEAARDLGNLILPSILRDDPTVSMPFQFTTSRGGDPGLTVLELSGVKEKDTVTPDQPLVLYTDAPLLPGEQLLPMAFDGEFFLPLGHARTRNGQTEIILERLPDPTSRGERDLVGSIRILFQKFVSQALKLDFPYPLLRAATVDDQGHVMYSRPDEVRAQVERANRILLYVHGIIGDTVGMVASSKTTHLQLNPLPPALGDQYDLILAFDYENIHTKLEDTARLLKTRLEDVGLGADHGKQLDIVAHSMGGLVSRWFIEREGGNRVVHHLVMLGTPNAGSPWPKVQDWATTSIALALNGFTVLGWPLHILGGLVGAVEKVDNALDQMAPGSDFLNTLTASDDPGVPYTLIAGNTSLRSGVLVTDSVGTSLLKRLLAKLSLETLRNGVTTLAFFGQPNDIAVSVTSITTLWKNRMVETKQLHEVKCDHITYFNSEAGLSSLAQALGSVSHSTKLDFGH